MIRRPQFATYLHPETMATSKPSDMIAFVGYSWPHWAQIWQALVERTASYATLPLRIAAFNTFGSVHTAAYLQQLQLMAAGTPPTVLPRLSAECSGLEYCLPGYQAGLGGMLEAIDQMRAGNLDRAYCFSLGGHHAYADAGHGYCALNPQAAALRYAQAHGFERVVIIDWDIHHGDGTQAIFANDATVFCISIHSAADLYMAKAAGLHAGTTTAAIAVGHCAIPVLNQVFDDTFFAQIGLSGRYYRAHEVAAIFERTLAELPWQPDLICIFSGYDGHRDDCGRQITEWTEYDFGHMTRRVLDHAALAGCPVLSVHGGGYKLPVTIASAIHHIDILATYQPDAA
jgi:acetoin utilization deacetylase AcuC-like enzyme